MTDRDDWRRSGSRILDRLHPELGMRHSLLLFIALGGCTTSPAGFRSSTPVATYTTAKLPKAVAQCLQGTLGSVALVRRGNRAHITSRDAPQLSLRIYDNGVAQVWAPKPFEARFRSSVESCL